MLLIFFVISSVICYSTADFVSGNCPAFDTWRESDVDGAPTCAILYEGKNCTGEHLPMGIRTAILNENSTYLRNENVSRLQPFYLILDSERILYFFQLTVYDDPSLDGFSWSLSALVRPGCYLRYEVEYFSSYFNETRRYV